MNYANIELLSRTLGSTTHCRNSHGPMGAFNLAYVTFDCGAPACIAGWAASLAGHSSAHFYTAAHFLGVYERWATNNLFAPSIPDYMAVTPAEAQFALTKMVEAGDDYINLTIHDLWPQRVEK